MLKTLTSFDLLIDQRHYYLVALQDKGGFNISDYWNQIGNVVQSDLQSNSYINSKFEMQHKQLQSEIPYPRGKLLDIVSLKHDGSPPYLYDLFAFKIVLDEKLYFVLAYPFAALAREIVDRVIMTRSMRNKCDILKVELPILVKSHQHQREEEDIHTQIVGLRVVIPDDPSLSSMSMGGDDPLKSSIFVNYLQNAIHDGTTNLEQCVLACELKQSINDTNRFNPQKLRSRVHIDKFGNFKFYVHIKGENFIIFPYLINLLKSLNCFDYISINPLYRLTQAEDED